MKLESLKKFAKDLGIKVSAKDKPKDIAKKIRKYWKENKIKVEFACPSCEEELPDIEECPFCGSEFAEDNGEEKEEDDEEEADEEK